MEPVVWTVDGSAVYGEYHAPPKKGRARVLCLHGFNSSHKEFGDFPARLAAAGFHVLAFDLRGHGASGGDPGRTDLDRAMKDVEGALKELDERGSGPLFAVGHSLGASYLLGMQARTGRFDALVIAHVVDRLFDELNPVERGAFHAIGRMHRRLRRSGRAMQVPYRISYRDIIHDKRARKDAKADPFLLKWVNVDNYEFASTMQATNWASRVSVPVLCIQSDKDKAVEPGHSRAVYDALAGPSDLLAHDGGHSCFLDGDRGRVVSGTIEWLERST